MSSYFEKQSPQIWFEFQNDQFKAEYIEVNQKINQLNGFREIILKRSQDGLFFNLTNDSTYFNQDQSRVNTFITSGFWSLQTKKSEGKNIKMNFNFFLNLRF